MARKTARQSPVEPVGARGTIGRLRDVAELYPDRVERVTLEASRRILGLVALGAAGFVATGLWLTTAREEPAGWFATAFFGFCLAVAFVAMLPGAIRLELTPEGMRVTALYRAWERTPWHHFAEFRVWGFGFLVKTRRVGWRYSVPPKKGRRMSALNRVVFGIDSCLPDSYGVRPADLAALLNAWRERYGGQVSVPPTES